MKLTYLILLTLAIIACLASVTEGRKNGKNGLSRRGKGGKRRNSVGGKGRGKSGGKKKRRQDLEKDDDENKNKKKRKSKGKKKNNRKNKKQGGKKRKGGKNFGKAKGGKSESYGKEKRIKMCKSNEIVEIDDDLYLVFKTMFPDQFFRVLKANPSRPGVQAGCKTEYCEGKRWRIVQHKCAGCDMPGGISYDVGQRIKINPFVDSACMVSPINPDTQPGAWQQIGSRKFPKAITDMRS